MKGISTREFYDYGGVYGWTHRATAHLFDTKILDLQIRNQISYEFP